MAYDKNAKLSIALVAAFEAAMTSKAKGLPEHFFDNPLKPKA
jgi:hypothetical protein